MTLAQLQDKVDAVKIAGRLPLSDAKMEVYQAMAFDFVTQLCYPLNLAIPYQDRETYRFMENENGVAWFLKKPRIATVGTEVIDIDSRLDMALVYCIAAYIANDASRAEFEQRAERVCTEYACEVFKMGLPKAKEVYEQESYIEGVYFDCVGQVYEVSLLYVKLIIDCLLCNGACMNASQAAQLSLYRKYLAGEAIEIELVERLRAVDAAVFTYTLNHLELYEAYTAEQIGALSTIPCEFEKIAKGETVQSWVEDVDRRFSFTLKG
jgi:hypothetical protein